MRRVLVTLGAGLLYWSACKLRVPGVDLRGLLPSEIVSTDRFSVLALGIMPFLTSFLLVELVALLLPWGRRLRRGGSAGRRRLNGLAVRLGFAVAVIQGLGLAIFMEHFTLPSGAALVSHPGLGFRLLVVVTLAAGSMLAFLVAQLITTYGFGNGFCLLLVYGDAWWLVESTAGLVSSTGPGGPRQMVALLFVPPAVLAVGWCFVRRPEIRVGAEANGGVPLTLPAFQQGVVPLFWTLQGLGLAREGYRLATGDEPGHFLDPVLGPILLVGLSVVTFHWFCSRERLEKNLPSGASLPDGALEGGRALVWTTALLALFAFGWLASEPWSGLRYLSTVGSGALIVVIAVGLDLLEEWRFRWRFGDSVVGLLELDNVHLAAYLRGRLRAQGIEAQVRSYHYRSLFFFFRPLVKMELLVPAARLERVREVVAQESLTIV